MGIAMPSIFLIHCIFKLGQFLNHKWTKLPATWNMCCDVQNKWMYKPIGMEQHVNEWLVHLRSLTWNTFKAKAKQFANDYLLLAKTRWTAWDPRRGEYAFQVSCRM